MCYRSKTRGLLESNFFGQVLKGYRRVGFSFVGCIVLLLLPLAVSAMPLDLPRDSEGWTIFTPSADTRIMYVSSSSGDDTTGVVYTRDSPEVGDDPFKPVGAIKPFATYTAAYANTRDGYPDWILVKRGDTLYETIYQNHRNGRSATEPFLVSSYGSSGLSPVFKVGGATAIRILNTGSWKAFVGLSFYAHTRDYDSPEFVSSSVELNGGQSISAYVNSTGRLDGILFEGCRFRYFIGGGFTNTNFDIQYDTGVVVRRCLFLDNYADTGQGHSAGIGGRNYQVTIEESIFDHNGWYMQRDPVAYPDNPDAHGQATIFNHNVYVSNLKNSVFRDNIFARGSSIGTKFTGSNGSGSFENFTIENNLYVDNEIGISFGNNYTEPGRFKNIIITGNVITGCGRSRQTLRTLGWGLTLDGFDSAKITNNYILHQNLDEVTLGQGISLFRVHQNVNISDNVLFGLKNTIMLKMSADLSAYEQEITFRGNKIDMPPDTGYIGYLEFTPTGTDLFKDNIYYTTKDTASQFRIEGVDKSFDEWKAATGDNSTFEQVAFPDPTRSIETYMAHLGETPTVDAFIEKCRAQDRYSWNPDYTASRVNAWIKAGFAIDSLSPPGPVDMKEP